MGKEEKRAGGLLVDGDCRLHTDLIERTIQAVRDLTWACLMFSQCCGNTTYFGTGIVIHFA